jgi:hypothetical protein
LIMAVRRAKIFTVIRRRPLTLPILFNLKEPSQYWRAFITDCSPTGRALLGN